MSKIFFDHYVEIEDIKIFIDEVAQTHEEKEDLWNLVDEYINHKIISSILTKLDDQSQEEFLKMFFDKPYDSGIISYLDSKLGVAVGDVINLKIEEIKNDLKGIFEISEKKNSAKKSLKIHKKKRRSI